MKQKFSRLSACFTLACMAAGCAQSVRPSAEHVGQRLQGGAETQLSVIGWLQKRGFKELDRHSFSGPWPRNGPCYEKARGGGSYGVDIVRVCYLEDNRPAVFSRQTHGDGWTEVFPNDMTAAPFGNKLYRISGATLEALDK
ncbi:hypothetical protein [Leisingera thetidis]|uniref:hypothetical protein n=1 Tax=Leisingera thetidis TaxID=2930199 RepID=UPI0021F7CE04|nr:hypothetical protein [Leisingera thetidis]